MEVVVSNCTVHIIKTTQTLLCNLQIMYALEIYIQIKKTLQVTEQ
jgi:predicted Zn-dependent protease